MCSRHFKVENLLKSEKDLIKNTRMVLISYDRLSDFQKWFFFYVIKHERVTADLEGILSDMCWTVKMNISVDDYDNEKKRLVDEATELAKEGLFILTPTGPESHDFLLTEKGELYVFQKIIKPLIDTKQQGKLNEILEYLKDSESKTLATQLINSIDLQDQRQSLKKIADIVLKYAMPTLKVIDFMHTKFPT